MTWQGRRLLSYNGSTFTYDVNGMRTTKTANDVTIAYYYDDGYLVAERRTTDSASSWRGSNHFVVGKGKASSALLLADKTVSNSAIGKVNGLRDA